MAARRPQQKWLWVLWAVSTIVLLAIGGMTMAFGGPRDLFLIGRTTDAHHQMELACNSCHTDWFGGREAIEKGCRTCHADDLTAAKDNHPAKKFRDPRNAERLAKLDATKCLTCHVEHRPGITGAMAVTIPMDYCSACHAEIGKERPSHVDFAFNTCADAGCHNYHDNRALYEDFLEKHLNEPAVKTVARLSPINWDVPDFGGVELKPVAAPAIKPDAPKEIAADAHVMSGWLASAHARADVNCSGCHQPKGARAADIATWIVKPGLAECRSCHVEQAKDFTKGKHGMRLADDMWTAKGWPFGIIEDKVLSPMRPELARAPMKAKAHGSELQCTTCHQAHDFNLKRAKVEACVSCHDDKHTKAFFASPHYQLWQAELAGKAPKGTGVTCATCHLPRTTHRGSDGVERWIVNHNQNDNLRPNEKMGRGVCMTCHGLGFTLDALADRPLIDRNFKGRPSVHVDSLDMVAARVRQREKTP